MTKGQCASALLAGVLTVALAGSAAGGFAGQLIAGSAAAQMTSTETFDTRFSNGEVQFNRERSEEEAVDGNAEGSEMLQSAYLTETDWRTAGLCSSLVFLFTVGMALSGIYRNLREEPLALLSESD